ncbi:MAG: hypothetical protein K2K45_06425 [Muribaculaceae bacterium]|nr:hypothetical protein [Muribaculaceae bacterium]
MNKLVLLTLLAILFVSCNNNEADALREHIQSDYTVTINANKLSSGSKAQYIQLEKSINQSYTKDLDSLVNTAFERQLERFEDKELGVWNSYMNMFSWLFKSKQSWNDEMNILSNRYFNSLDIHQEQHILYENYLKGIKNIRQQFISGKGLPAYTQIDLPSEKISLDTLSEYSRNNIVIEFGTQLFEWLLTFIIIQIVLLFVDKIAGPWGCLIDIIVFLIIIVISMILANSNDSKLIDSLREQQAHTIKYDTKSITTSLDDNTVRFYENL